MFKVLLSPESRARIERDETEALRLYSLLNRWLAEELLRMGRALQVRLRGDGRRASDAVYDTVLAWHIIPEVAKRLGATRFHASERTDGSIVCLNNGELRHRAGYCLLNTGTRPESIRILFRDPANGNPLVFAMDRLAPAGPEDPIGRRLAEVARHRGTPYKGGVWEPAIIGKRAALEEGIPT